MKKLIIEWRHLDVEGETCNRCYDTGENLNAEVKRLNRTLAPEGITVEWTETKLDLSKILESNSLYFNGAPIEELLNIQISESYCESCTDLCGDDTYCRTVLYEGQEYEDIPAKAIREAALIAMSIKTKTPATDSNDLAPSGCGCSNGSCC